MSAIFEGNFPSSIDKWDFQNALDVFEMKQGESGREWNGVSHKL